MRILRFLFLLTLLSSFSGNTKTIKLQYNFTVGDQYEWIQTTNQTIKQSIMGMDQVIENTVKGSLILKVVSVIPNGAKIEARYTGLSMVMKLPAGLGEQNMNSNGDQEKTENKIMKALMDKPFTITLTKQGNIESIDGEENLWSDFSSLGLSEQQTASMKTSLEQNLSESSLKSSFEMVLSRYPESALKPGDTWKNKVATGAGFPLETENTWSFTGLAAENANLMAAGLTTTTDKQKIIMLPNGIKSNVDLAGTQKLTSLVNVKTGWPTTVNVTSEIKGNMNLLAGGMIPQDMAVPMVINTISDFTITKK